MAAEDVLSLRELRVLGAVVRNYILQGNPLGSRALSRQEGLGVSAATIRNVMMDLEEAGFITHPHTSAGRIPTDRGYRYYVDHLMTLAQLPPEVKERIRSLIVMSNPSDLHLLMEAVSRALSQVTDQLGVVLAPRLASGVFRHVHIHEVEPRHFLMHLTIDSGFVKIVAVELQTGVPVERLEAACRIMNERFCGRHLEELGDCGVLLDDLAEYDIGTIRLFVPALRKVADEQVTEVFAEGPENIMLKPEFFDRDRVHAIVEMLRDRSLLVHVLRADSMKRGNVVITIGRENKSEPFGLFSVVKSDFRVGNLCGTLGVVGPTRMPYGYLASAVEYTAELLDKMYS